MEIIATCQSHEDCTIPLGILPNNLDFLVLSGNRAMGAGLIRQVLPD
jgi:hypothetical protein